MARKLLQGTLKYYLLYSLLVMLLAAPLFYLATQYLYMEEADEGLLLLQREFISNSMPVLKENDISVWNKFNRDVKIERATKDLKESVFQYRIYHDTLDTEDEPYRMLLAPVSIQGKPYTFVARTNLVSKQDLIFSVLCLFIVIVVLLFIGLFVINRNLSLRLWKPFYETLALIEAFEIDKTNVRKLPQSNIEEFSRLNLAINKLIEKNTAIYKSQKEFIENAAHELQTPIAVFKGKIEILLQRSDVTEGQYEILGKLNDATTRLNRLNKNLLLLSKIESNQFIETEQVSLTEIVSNQLGFFTEQAAAKNLTINIEYVANSTFQGNHFLAETLISNLFLNAIKHNTANGTIDVKLDANTLLFSNSGSTNPLQSDTLFERFSKAGPASNGNGLGLSIIKKIADLNHWSVAYGFSQNMHTFEFKL